MGGVYREGWLAQADRRIGEAFAALAVRPAAAAAFLILLCCALYLPGISSLPVTDRDEARFAQATKQMLETGDFVDIRFQEEPRYKKPIGIYWLQSASVSALTAGSEALDVIWAYRIPSFLGALLAVLATWWAARPIVGRGPALLAAILFASCLTLAFEARIAKSDAALIGFIALAQGALFRLYLTPPGQKTGKLAAVFWVALGLGILIKGPIAPLVAAFTVAVVLWRDRDRAWLKNLHPVWGAPLMLAMTLPWFIAITISSGGEFWRLSLGEDFLGKIKSGQEAHGAPPGFYFILFWWTFWPAALFATGGAAIWLWRNRRLPRALFLLAWIVPFWIAIELTPTKLPHYALPFYPAIAIAAAWILRRKAFGPELPARTYKQAAVLFAAIAGLHIAAVASFAWLFEVEAGAILPVALLLIAALAAACAIAAWRKRVNFAAASAVLTAVVFYATAFQIAIPRLDPVWISRSAESALDALSACGHGPVALSGYREPSAVFKFGTNTLLANPEEAGAALASGEAAFALIGLQQGGAFEESYRKAAGVDPYRLGCVDGFNLNRGQPLRLTIYAAAQSQAVAACVPPPQFQCRPKEEVRWRRVLDTEF